MIDRSLPFAAVALGFLLLCGCYAGTKSRGKLSDAMSAASDDNKGSREVSTRDTLTVPPDSGYAWRRRYHRDDSRHYYRGSLELGAFYQSLGLVVGNGLLKSKDFYRLSMVGVSYEELWAPSKRIRLDFNGRIAQAPIQQTSKLSESLDGGVTLLQGGFDVNYFTTPHYTFMGHYLFAGFQVTSMWWSYRNAITTTQGEVITGDQLGGLDVSLGMGWNPIQVKWFNIGLEAAPGVILWADETSKGFDNDVFPDLFYLLFNATMKFNFGRDE